LFNCLIEESYLFTIVVDKTVTRGERNLGRDLDNM
jgi:hypothetical protein